MTTQGHRLDRTIVFQVLLCLCTVLVASPACFAQTCQREAEDPCCLHLTGQTVPCVENCNGGSCCWQPDLSVLTVVADDVLYATGQHQIQFLIWDDRCRYKAPNCSTGTCQHPGAWILRDCIIAKPNPDDCP
jgi:hypothetical protein